MEGRQAGKVAMQPTEELEHLALFVTGKMQPAH
jgi:hypothetical protein